MVIFTLRPCVNSVCVGMIEHISEFIVEYENQPNSKTSKNPENLCGVGVFEKLSALGELGRATGSLQAVLCPEKRETECRGICI